jgi:type II secretory pathway component PulJ
MKFRVNRKHVRTDQARGISLIECLVYIALLSVIVGGGYVALYHTVDNHRNLRRNSDDVATAVNVGELWRKDIRSATGTIVSKSDTASQQLRIPTKQGSVTYEFTGGQLRRQLGPGAPWTLLLLQVQASNMIRDRRERVTAWRWELTLKTKSSQTRVVPCFSFQAVPGSL